MPTGDIPEVEAEIAAMSYPLASHYRAASRDALEEMQQELEEHEVSNDKAKVAAVVLLLLLLMRRRVTQRMSRRRQSAATASARRLILGGALSTGSVGRLRARGRTIDRAARRAGRELAQMSALRVQADRISAKAEALLTEFLTTETARRSPLDRIITERGIAEKERELERLRDRERREGTRKSSAAVKRQEKELRVFQTKHTVGGLIDGSHGSMDKAEWRARLEQALLSRNGTLSRMVTDAWAYRLWNMGAYLAAKSTRVEVLIARNPKDERTTKFCNWVHGKIITVKRVERQLDSFQTGLQAGDRDKALGAWPFIDQSTKALNAERQSIGRGRGSRASLQEVFRRFFAKVGLPPYHFRCRTIAVPRTFEE